MKRLLFIIFTFTLFISCSTTTDHDPADEIKGEWVWVESSGGIAGTTETPESTQQVVTLEISGNSIRQFVNGNLKSDRNFIIARKESLVYGDAREMIIYENGFQQIFSTTGNQLILIGDCNDCFQSLYQRK